MKTLIPLTALAALFASSSLFAQTPAFSKPSGYVTIPLPGTGGSTPTRLQLASQQLLPSGSTEFTGVAESFTGSTLNDVQGTWVAGAFVNPTPPTGFPNHTHLVEITSGPLTGTFTWITGSAAGTLTTYDNISAAGSNASYRIVKAFTLASLMGDVPTATVLGGGSNAANADNFLIFNSELNSYTTFYYKNAGISGGTGWRSSVSSSVNVASVAIHPTDSSLVFVRKQSASGSLVVTGEVKSGVTDVVIRGGAGTGPNTQTLNIIQVPIPVNQLTLGASGLYTGNSTTGLLGGSNAANADNVLVFNAATNSYTTYYYKNAGISGGTGWRSSTSSSIDESATALPSTSAILIQRKSNGTDFIWQVPAVVIGQ